MWFSNLRLALIGMMGVVLSGSLVIGEQPETGAAIKPDPVQQTSTQPARPHSESVAKVNAKSVSLRRPAPERTHPIDPALRRAEESLQQFQATVDDYTALFVKRCRVHGQLPPLQFAHLKVRNRKTDSAQLTTPMSVYLDYLRPKSVKGREVIWVENENNGKIVVHQGGLAGLVTLYLDPNGSLAMRGQRYPIGQIGIENLLRQLVEVASRDRQFDECIVKIEDNVKLVDYDCTRFTITHPVKREHFRFHRAVVYFDNETNIPIRYRAWIWPETPAGKPILDEEYSYLKIKLNAGLTNFDFDPSNPNYRYAE